MMVQKPYDYSGDIITFTVASVAKVTTRVFEGTGNKFTWPKFWQSLHSNCLQVWTLAPKILDGEGIRSACHRAMGWAVIAAS